MKDALQQSENYQLEQALLQDHLTVSDRDTTYEALEEAVARESYLTWLREQEMRTRSGQHGLEVRGGVYTYTGHVAMYYSVGFNVLFSCGKLGVCDVGR